MISPRIPLAKQAWAELTLSTAAFGAAAVGLFAAPGVLTAAAAGTLGTLWAALLLFFRDPERRAPQDVDAVLAPADGRVMEISTINEPAFIQGQALKIGIFMSLLDVHVNRAPLDGTVEWTKHFPGQHLAAFRPDASTRNEHNLIGMRYNGRKVLVKQIAGVMARRIVCSVQPGQALSAGQRLGMIKFGSRVEVFLPPNSLPAVEVGDQVRGGVTIVARKAA